MSVPKHQSYKDSGVSWLGLIPSHWATRRTRRLCEIKKRIVGELGFDVLSITQTGIRVKDTESNDGQVSMDYSKYQLVEPGDFAMNHMDLLTGFVDISPVRGVTSPDYRVFSLREENVADPKYMLYLFQNGYINRVFYAFGQGSSQFGRWRMPSDQFNELTLPLPPLEEQVSIAAFLDREIAKIDTLVDEQERLVALLKEKRRTVISKAVTKGLDPNVPVKDSGVAWLGNVPAHWAISSLKRIVETPITDGPHETPNFPDEGVPFVSAEAVSSGLLNFEKKRGYISHEDHQRYSLKYLPRRGDIFMIKSGATTGVTAIVETDLEFNIWSPLAVVRCNEYCDPYFVLNFMRSKNFLEAVTLNWSFGTQQNIGMGVVENLSVPVPPRAEQKQIVAFLSTVVGKLDSLTAEADGAIPLLKERRSALISAAVTGKIDVRGLVPQPEAVAA